MRQPCPLHHDHGAAMGPQHPAQTQHSIARNASKARIGAMNRQEPPPAQVAKLIAWVGGNLLCIGPPPCWQMGGMHLVVAKGQPAVVPSGRAFCTREGACKVEARIHLSVPPCAHPHPRRALAPICGGGHCTPTYPSAKAPPKACCHTHGCFNTMCQVTNSCLNTLCVPPYMPCHAPKCALCQGAHMGLQKAGVADRLRPLHTHGVT